MRAPNRPLPQTRALLAAKPQRPLGLASFHDVAVEEELWAARALARHLWGLLERRHPTEAMALRAELTEDMLALADRSFEAAMILRSRDRIVVEPVRQLLDCQRDRERQYLVTRPGTETEVVSETKLVMMAGLPAEDSR